MENKRAKIMPVEATKGFRVINVPREVLEAVTGQIKCVCDDCLCSPDSGYYIAVLNWWLCPTCYERWLKHAVRYAEDISVEKRNFEYYVNLLKRWRYL